MLLGCRSDIDRKVKKIEAGEEGWGERERESSEGGKREEEHYPELFVTRLGIRGNNIRVLRSTLKERRKRRDGRRGTRCCCCCGVVVCRGHCGGLSVSRQILGAVRLFLIHLKRRLSSFDLLPTEYQQISQRLGVEGFEKVDNGDSGSLTGRRGSLQNLIRCDPD
jgi:hypothetical protein